MKLKALAFCLACLAAPAFSEARVDLHAALGTDFIGSSTINQAVQAMGSGSFFGGFGWEVVPRHTGIGGDYLVNFFNDDSGDWWLDWNGQALYASYHIFGGKAFLDPFVDGGIGCAGRVFLRGSGGTDSDALAISLYPFVSAGASLRLDGLRIGAKLSYAIWESAIPVTFIPAYQLGRVQAYALVGFSF
jgi:hypothetical protein